MKPLNRCVRILLLSLFIVACDNAEPAAEGLETSQAGLFPREGSAPQTITVMIQGMAFVPAQIEVPAGTIVSFANADIVLHTATSRDGSWSSGQIATGGSWERRFIEPGIYSYYCSNHLLMMGALVVR
jgi:plastocyanin